tara:strand:+ start:47 stop:1135 length:1089 start_codon:yes stop_codon:yes gene_type:complete
MSELIKIENVEILECYSSGGLKIVLNDIEKLARDFEVDLSTVKGRKQIASMANKVSKSKVYLDELGKSLTADWKAKSKRVDNERKVAREFLDNLRDDIRKPLTDFENEEKERVRNLELRLNALSGFLVPNYNLSSEHLQMDLDKLNTIELDSSWSEYLDKATDFKTKGVDSHVKAIQEALKKELEKAELEKLRQEKIDRDKKDNEERIAREAKEQAEKKAIENAHLIAEKVEREKREAFERENIIQQAKIEAEKRAIELEKKAIQGKKDSIEREKQRKIDEENARELAVKQAQENERLRVKKETEQAEIEAKKREANKKHRAKINNGVVDYLMANTGVTSDQAKKIVSEIASGNMPSVKIFY